MLRETERALAFRCLACGRLHAHRFSLFALSQQSLLALDCSCGCRKSSLWRRGRMMRIECACIVCDTFHTIVLPINQIARGDVVALVCPRTGVAIGSVGDEASAMSAAAHDALDGMVLDPQYREFFRSPRVMHALLQGLQGAMELDRLACACGGDSIAVDVYPEKVELVCASCGSVVIIYAEDEGDLSTAIGFQSITLPAASAGRRALVRLSSKRVKG